MTISSPPPASGRHISPQCASRRCGDCTQHEPRPPEPQHGIGFAPCTHECHVRPRVWEARR